MTVPLEAPMRACREALEHMVAVDLHSSSSSRKEEGGRRQSWRTLD